MDISAIPTSFENSFDWVSLTPFPVKKNQNLLTFAVSCFGQIDEVIQVFIRVYQYAERIRHVMLPPANNFGAGKNVIHQSVPINAVRVVIFCQKAALVKGRDHCTLFSGNRLDQTTDDFIRFCTQDVKHTHLNHSKMG